jgi:ABC-type Fe3+/spermidine/putrescine transport system ATPase subunit
MITLERITKTWPVRDGVVRAVDDVTLAVPEGSFFALLGPSGCGKTTTLRIVAGLEVPDAGTVRIGSEVMFSRDAGIIRPPHTRGLGMVFQSYAVWPHLTVEQNVMFPLNRMGLSREEIGRRTADVLRKVGMTDHAKKPATKLSGGQQQRVALARALVGNPKVLLLDEPLSNLDAKLREEMRRELKDIHREVGITTLYVTHDQHEALSMADLVAVMNQGRVVEVASPTDIYFRPKVEFTARFVGRINQVAPGGVLPPLLFRPEDVLLRAPGAAEDPATELVVGRGRVRSVMFLGERGEARIDLEGADTSILAHVPGRATPRDGEAVVVVIKREAIIVLAGSGHREPASPAERSARPDRTAARGGA